MLIKDKQLGHSLAMTPLYMAHLLKMAHPCTANTNCLLSFSIKVTERVGDLRDLKLNFQV